MAFSDTKVAAMKRAAESTSQSAPGGQETGIRCVSPSWGRTIRTISTDLELENSDLHIYGWEKMSFVTIHL